jgi:RNA polymerase sigma factor (sigma-70 family)
VRLPAYLSLGGVAMSEKRAESELLCQAVAGDRTALSELLLVHYDGLRQHIGRRISGDLQRLILADDVLHQTFVRAAGGIRSFQPRHERAFRAWLKTIADNLIKDAEKRRRRERRAADQQVPLPSPSGGNSWAALVERIGGDATTPSVAGQRNENVRRLRAALASLPAEQREVLERYCLHDQSLDQIAEALGATKDSIRGICYRAKKNLRALMGRSSLYFSG